MSRTTPSGSRDAAVNWPPSSKPVSRYDGLAAELGVSRERVRQLETSALEQLAQAAMNDLYAPLRWRAASAARADARPVAEIPGAPSWMR